MKKLIILIIVLLGSANLSISQIDTCLIEPIDAMVEDYTYYEDWINTSNNFNTDSLLLDTCNSYPGNWIYFAKRYEIAFEINIFPRDTIINDSDRDSVFTINDLPTKYNHFFSSLDSIRLLFGDNYFVDDYLDIQDTLPGFKRFLTLTFHNYYNIDSVVTKIEKISIVNTIYERGEIGSHTGSVYHNVPKNIEIFPNPSTKIINLKSKELIQSIFIFDIRGTEIDHIKAPNIEQIDIRDLQTGTYFMIINNKYIHKFIKE